MTKTYKETDKEQVNVVESFKCEQCSSCAERLPSATFGSVIWDYQH